MTVTSGRGVITLVIANLITIYDGDSEDLEATIVPIVNESDTKY
jgi:hypothetical protein